MGVSTIKKVVQQTLDVLWKTLQPDVLKLLSSEDECLIIIQNFFDMWQFPNCFGAMDGKHIMMQVRRFLSMVVLHSKRVFII